MKKLFPGALAICAVGLSGCTTGGFFCKADHEDPKIAALMQSNCSGDRHAALQLGFLFEGRGDLQQAAHYYGIAATPSAGQTYIYVPPAGDVAGYVMPVDTGPRTPGSAEAQYRLAVMYRDGSGVEQNARKARKLFRQAAEQGHAGAQAALDAAPG